MAGKSFNVLFLCTGNSARSIMAENILNFLGRGKFKACSAGSKPKGKVEPFAIRVLETANTYDGKGRSKSWDEFTKKGAPRLDFVFTVCDHAANEECPVWPGQPISAHWGIPDPAAAEGSEEERYAAFLAAYRQLYNRIDIFVNLPLAELDRVKLQGKLDDIGKIED